MACAAILLCAGPAGAQDRFTASNGAVLRAPAIEGLTCGQMAALLVTYTASGYRDFGPVHLRQPDRAIFEYETALAEAHYEKCQREGVHFQDVAPAFSKGFQ